MKLHTTAGEPLTTDRHILTADINIWVHSMAWAVIPSDVYLMESEHPVVLYSMLVGSGLLVDQGVVVPSNDLVSTRVFNLTATPIRIRRGDALSMLVSLPPGAAHDKAKAVAANHTKPSTRRRTSPRADPPESTSPVSGPTDDHG